MDKNILNRQSQHWENNFSNKPEMFGLEPSLPAKKALNIFKENNYSKIVELGAGLGRDSIYFAKNSINVTALDYSENGIKISKKFDIHPVHLALAFCTKRPFMGSVIFGATTDEQLDVVIKGLDVDLSDEVMEEISLVYKNYALTF